MLSLIDHKSSQCPPTYWQQQPYQQFWIQNQAEQILTKRQYFFKPKCWGTCTLAQKQTKEMVNGQHICKKQSPI